MATRFTQALGNFKIPKDIRDDIIYCQRALKSYIKVHQIIVDQYSKDKEFGATKQVVLAEVENEIYEINCEQQYLLLRIRRIIDEFLKSLQREDVWSDRMLINEHVSRQLVPYVQNKDYICIPTTVRIRNTEKQLLETYLYTDGWKYSKKSPTPPAVPIEIPQPPPEPPMPAIFNAKQVSLLKPISERVIKVAPVRSCPLPEIIIPDDEKSLPLAVHTVEPVLPVSSKVKLSRLNLRQALNKAAAAINVVTAHATPIVVHNVQKQNKISVEVVRKPQPKAVKSEPSSSEESLDARVPSPQDLDIKTMPDDYNQEMFLRLFNLFTKEQIQQLQQRRSKRKRRTVHNNEKADFHYGRIDHMLSPHSAPSKKRKKEFLLSPRDKVALKKKRYNEADRSNSSSPDEKTPCCNECMKRSGIVTQCKECLGCYHEKCHKDVNVKAVLGQCPSCSRVQYSKQQEADKVNVATLHGKCLELELKLAKEHQRREKLQQESKKYKIDMRNLFNIVETIKNDEYES